MARREFLSLSVEDLRRIPPAIHELSAGSVLVRIYCTEGPYPTSWKVFRSYGPIPTGRFDHHNRPPHEQERGILYCADTFATSLAEVFQDTEMVSPHLLARHLVIFKLTSRLKLLDLTNEDWRAETGIPSEINACSRPVAQDLSQKIYEAFPEIHGIFYSSSRYARGWNVALYERAATAVPETPDLDEPLALPELRTPLENATDEIGYLLDLIGGLGSA